MKRPGSEPDPTPAPAPYGPSDAELRSILGDARTIAVVGLSSKPERDSYDIASYLQEHGYRVVPVNPNETEVLGEVAYPSLLDVPRNIRIDVVDVFRRAADTPPIAREAVHVGGGAMAAGRDRERRGAPHRGGGRTHGHHGGMYPADPPPARRGRELIGGMQNWEYFVAPLLEHNPGEILNTFGEDGWELVSVLQLVNPMGGQSLVAYLKRPKA